MDPLVLNQLAQIRAQMGRAPGVTGAQLAELLRLRRKGEEASAGSKGALERLKGLGAQSQEVAGEMQSVYSDVPVYKRPVREGVSKGAMNFGLLLGGLGALAGVEDPQNLTGTAIGGQKALKDQAYYDALDTLKERQEADREARMGKIQGLQAKLGGIGAQMDVAQTEQSVLGNEATRIGSELFNREESARQQSNIDRQFFVDAAQRGFTNALALRADKRAEFEKQMRLNPLMGLDEQAKSLAPVFGGDVDKARQALVSDFIVNQAKAEWMPKMLEQEYKLGETQAKEAAENLRRIQTMNEWLPKQLAQEFAANELSMANTRQTMAARAAEMKRASGPQLTMLEADQINDANKVIEGERKTQERFESLYADLKTKQATGELDDTKFNAANEQLGKMLAASRAREKAAKDEKQRLLGG